MGHKETDDVVGGVLPTQTHTIASEGGEVGFKGEGGLSEGNMFFRSTRPLLSRGPSTVRFCLFVIRFSIP